METAVNNEKAMLVSCGAALATLVPVALHQTGFLSHLPDPPSAIFDSDRITESKAAHPFGVPDSLLGLANFGATMALIVAARKFPLARRLLGLKLAMDAGAATFNAGRQVVSFGRLCSWCTGTALATGMMAYAGRKEISESLRCISTNIKADKHG